MLLLQGGHKCRAHRPCYLPGLSLRCNLAGCNLAGGCSWGRPHCSCRASCHLHKKSMLLSLALSGALSLLAVSCPKRKLSCAANFCYRWTRKPLQCITNFYLHECCTNGVYGLETCVGACRQRLQWAVTLMHPLQVYSGILCITGNGISSHTNRTLHCMIR